MRCVRGGLQNQGAMRPKSESTEAQPGTVTDSSTGLMWQKKPDGKQRDWQNAKWYCEGLSLGGYSDWVVPNMDVLWDMLDKKDLFDPFELEQWYWTSTSKSKDFSSAWSVGFHYGYAEYYSKNSGGYVRCVRGGKGQQ